MTAPSFDSCFHNNRSLGHILHTYEQRWQCRDGVPAATLRDESSSESEPLVACVRAECPPMCVERARGAYCYENNWNQPYYFHTHPATHLEFATKCGWRREAGEEEAAGVLWNAQVRIIY